MCSNQLSYCREAGGTRTHDPIDPNEVWLRYGTCQVIKNVRGNERQAY